MLIGLLAPGLALDRITISDSYIEQDVGFWFAPTTRFRFADIAAIHIGMVKDAEYRDRKAWFIRYRDMGILRNFDRAPSGRSMRRIL